LYEIAAAGAVAPFFVRAAVDICAGCMTFGDRAEQVVIPSVVIVERAGSLHHHRKTHCRPFVALAALNLAWRSSSGHDFFKGAFP
jgi:hypothetical protein